MKKILVITLIFLLGHIPETKGQEIESFLWNNPWLEGFSAAGMIFSTEGYSDISLFTGYRGGEFRNVYDPSSSIKYGLQTRSCEKLGNIYLGGSFRYSYQTRKDQKWLGMLDPYRTPFMLADSVAGNYVLETYCMTAGMAIPISKKWTAGWQLSYDARNGAKHRDLRNSDTYMDFMVAPSLVYENGPARIGAHLYFRRITEQIDYTQVETSTNKVLFSFSGMWFNTQQVFTSSAPRTRLVKDHLYGGGITIHLSPGRFSIFDYFSAGLRKQTQREDVVLARKFGDVREWTWQNKLLLQYGSRHRLTADVAWAGLTGYQPVQRQELNPASRLWEWVQYGTIPAFLQESAVTDLSYSYRVPHDGNHDAWRFSVGIYQVLFQQQWIRYPLAVLRSWDRTEGYLDLTRNWFFKKWMFGFSPALSYGAGRLEVTDSQGSAFDVNSQIIGFENPENFHLSGPAALENEFMTTKRLAAEAKIRITFLADRARGLNLFAETGYRYMRSLTGNKKMFHQAGLNIGLIF
ncbi:MAG: DUF6850 family outer membrane beta-barrel protein [Bacteroidales bacterium]|nr:hypothetical protein [Bacteroidales bacterium]MDD2264027.1 hypothetical protein [Bacteroidales bacterium]MDD2831261.1 hypothetical protein [Bacteroidales bacterium]MDD3208626.1 hypothetical protein [Bacteroidales bacterium]MDD3697189.1 hypothetical protein [Bacteroidales bacterium]